MWARKRLWVHRRSRTRPGWCKLRAGPRPAQRFVRRGRGIGEAVRAALGLLSVAGGVRRVRGRRGLRGWLVWPADAARDQVRLAGLGMVDDDYFGAVCGAHGGGGEHLFGGPAADQLPVGDQVHGVAEQRGEADVVDGGQDGDAETGDELQDLDLVADVEVAGRLVQWT